MQYNKDRERAVGENSIYIAFLRYVNIVFVKTFGHQRLPQV